jgi:ABC-type sugar transport system ATPase subunit
MPPINLLAGTLEQNDGQLWFSSESGRLRLDEKPLAWLAGATQRPVVAGIRPESFVLCDAPLEHHSLAVTVSTTELLGSLMDVTLRTPDGAQLVCRTPSRALAEGQQLWAHVAPQDILLFEPERSGSSNSSTHGGRRL